MAQATREKAVPPQQGKDPDEPDSPLELEARDWKATLKRTVREVKEDRVTLTAGALAYYWFLAVFPTVMAAVGLVALLRLPRSSVSDLVDGIRTALPGEAADVITSAVTNAQSRASGGLVALILGLAVALWSASSGVNGMVTGLNIAYDVPDRDRFLKKRAVAILLLFALLVLGGISAALLVFGAPIGEAISDAVPVGATAFVYVWTVVRWLGAILAITTLFALFYFVGPNREAPTWEWISPGGVLATLIWLAASLGFSFYVSSFGSYAETYGALAGVVVLVLWLYLTGLAVLLGGELNAELERQSQLKKSRTT